MPIGSFAVPPAVPAAPVPLSSPSSSLPVHNKRRIVRIPLPPAARYHHAKQDSGSSWTQSATGAVVVADRHADDVVSGSAHNASCAADPLSLVTAISAGGADIRSPDNTAPSSAIALPSDVIDAIADAVIGATHLSDSRLLAMQRLGVPLSISDESQSALRILTHVCHAWRIALLPRAWRSVQLTGSGSPSARDMHAFAGACVRRLVVPWGALAAPVSWARVDDSCSESEGDEVNLLCDDFEDSVKTSGSHSSCDKHTDTITGFSVDGFSRLRLPKDDSDSANRDRINRDAVGNSRLRCVFGDQVWPSVEHLDMSFMPLICYQGFGAHVQQTMPRLRSLRIGGFVPATALADILQCARLLPLVAVEIAGSVWANSDSSGRRGSSSSWRSSLSTVAPNESAAETSLSSSPSSSSELAENVAAGLVHSVPGSNQLSMPAYPLPLATLAVTADALRSPAVFAFALAQSSTLKTLHLLECDYKIVDMLRFGRLEERHMHAVEWGATQMVLRSSEQAADGRLAANNGGGRGGRRAARERAQQQQLVQWTALTHLHIERFFMTPRENAGLRIHADSMPGLQELVIGHMEPSDSHHPAPAAAGASQLPRLRGVFAHLRRIRAPVFDIQTLPSSAPALHTLHIAGSGCVLAQTLAPTQHDIDALMTSGLRLKRFIVDK
ncbi:hypothetical protein J3B02_001152 [Coemansia erecta]|uniref:Uncharacterized protein n=1 Tax=Coemansia asiatica TaxID=1052880 RepID=A0A9W7XS03_9FUNG|nr:hypothetical protein LPJ64_000452 [Coemansia asiatica]KAJ2857216.1 hypothetical protein J3B02_001152 [Coemansia erecta]